MSDHGPAVLLVVQEPRPRTLLRMNSAKSSAPTAKKKAQNSSGDPRWNSDGLSVGACRGSYFDLGRGRGCGVGARRSTGAMSERVAPHPAQKSLLAGLTRPQLGQGRTLMLIATESSR